MRQNVKRVFTSPDIKLNSTMYRVGFTFRFARVFQKITINIADSDPCEWYFVKLETY